MRQKEQRAAPLAAGRGIAAGSNIHAGQVAACQPPAPGCHAPGRSSGSRPRCRHPGLAGTPALQCSVCQGGSGEGQVWVLAQVHRQVRVQAARKSRVHYTVARVMPPPPPLPCPAHLSAARSGTAGGGGGWPLRGLPGCCSAVGSPGLTAGQQQPQEQFGVCASSALSRASLACACLECNCSKHIADPTHVQRAAAAAAIVAGCPLPRVDGHQALEESKLQVWMRRQLCQQRRLPLGEAIQHQLQERQARSRAIGRPG